MSAPALYATLHPLAELDARLPAALSVLVGLAALAVVAFEEIWNLAQHVYTIAHEGAHGLAGASFGHKIVSIELRRNGSGLTTRQEPGRSGRIAAPFAGYLGASVFGLIAAKLISLGYMAAVLWIGLALLALMLPVLRKIFSFVPVIVTGALLLLVACSAATGLLTVVAYGLTWFLLLSGLRVILVEGHLSKEGDAGNLRKITHLPWGVWLFLWLVGTIVALTAGGSLLV
jgi:Peptidase M50B-like